MPFQSVPDCASVAITFTQNGAPLVNVLNFRKAGGYEPADIVDLASGVDAWVATQYLPAIVPSCNYDFVTARGLELEADTVVIDDDNTGPGESTFLVPQPNNVTCAIRFTTGVSGRHGRGRCYVVGMPTAFLDANENYIAASVAGTYVTIFEALNSYVDSAGWAHVIVSRWLNGSKRTTGVYRTVTGYSFHDRKVDTLRRRMENA